MKQITVIMEANTPSELGAVYEMPRPGSYLLILNTRRKGSYRTQATLLASNVTVIK